ncbi:MAG: TetR family transcriptional regulator [Burkholderiales bacterium]|nr:TetR family transcriptional regulator [Burkholderiales bacterium]
MPRQPTPAKAPTARSAKARASAPQRKAPRDPEQTRARILVAARNEFARYGLGGARVDRIAAAAGANKRMLYYYFGNKDALFLAVLEGAYEHIRDAEKALHLTEIDPPEAIRRLIAFTWEYYLEHPEFMTLLNSANLHRARHLEKSTKVRSMHSPFVAMIEEILERGRRAGVFRAGVDPVQLYVSIAALTYFYLGNKYTLSAIFGRDLMSPRARAERLGHMTELVLGYLFKT